MAGRAQKARFGTVFLDALLLSRECCRQLNFAPWPEFSISGVLD